MKQKSARSQKVYGKDRSKSLQSQNDSKGSSGAKNQKILINEDKDVMAKYRIPIKDNAIDFNLQLPDDSDSSNFESEDKKKEHHSDQKQNENNQDQDK